MYCGHLDTVSCIGMSLSANLIVSGSWDKTIKLWTMHNAECLATLNTNGMLQEIKLCLIILI